MTIDGYVQSLSKEKILADSGTVAVLANIYGRQRRIFVEVSSQSHKKAIQAYGDNARVICTGKLIKKGKFWHLQDPSDITIEVDEGSD